MSSEMPKWIKPEDLGGEDKKEKEEKEIVGYDKKNHALRSLFWQPNHKNHFKKEPIVMKKSP